MSVRAVPRVARAARQRQRLLHDPSSSCTTCRRRARRRTTRTTSPASRDVPRYFGENIANMRQGIADGFVLPAEVMPGIASVIAARAIREAPKTRRSGSRSRDFPDSVPEADRARLAEAGRAAIEQRSSRPTRTFKAFFDNEYRPAARTVDRRDATCRTARPTTPTSCATTRPCRMRRRRRSTRRASPRSARIRAEMEAIVRELGFRGSFDGVPRVPAQRPAVLREDARAAPALRRLDHARDRRTHAGLLRTHSPRALHGHARARGARAELHGAAATTRGRSARRANTGSTRTRCRTARSTRCPR